MIKKNYENLSLILLLFLFSYFFIETGLHGDDLNYIEKYHKLSFNEYFSINPNSKENNTFFALTSHFAIFWPYAIFNENLSFVYDILKILLTYISIFFVYSFLNNYCSKKKSIISSIIFILYPTHDSTFFWYTSIIHIFGPCCLLYIYSIAHKLKNKWILILFLPATFISYSSPPFLIGLIVLSILERKKIEFYYLTIFTLTYFILYISFNFYYPNVATRISDDLLIADFLKNIILKILTSIDTNFGPSLILKLFFSIVNNSLESAIILIFSFILFLNYLKKKQPNVKKKAKTLFHLG